jgi:hypothetical protein
MKEYPPEPAQIAKPAVVRRKGFLRFLGGLAVFAIGLAFTMLILPRLGVQLTPVGLAAFALPGAYALSGLVEIVTGISFMQFARRWDDLKGWQRGVFGTFIVLLAGMVIILGVGFFAFISN